ncbi:MAG TPA: hypothetical protein VIM56_11340 [Rhizomicrobium sp.]
MARKQKTVSLQVPLPVSPHPLVARRIRKEMRDWEAARKSGSGFYGSCATDTGRRMLHLHDAILKQGEARGFETGRAIEQRSEYGFCIRGEDICWRVDEKHRREKALAAIYGSKSPDHLPDGILTVRYFVAYGPDHLLEDRPDAPLIARVGEILDGMDAIAAQAAVITAEHRLEELRERENAAREARYWKIVDGEEERWKLLRHVSGNSFEAARLRKTVSRIRKRLSDAGIDTPRLKAWLAWAENRIARHDVFSGSAEEIYDRLIARPQPEEDDEDGELL